MVTFKKIKSNSVIWSSFSNYIQNILHGFFFLKQDPIRSWITFGIHLSLDFLKSNFFFYGRVHKVYKSQIFPDKYMHVSNTQIKVQNITSMLETTFMLLPYLPVPTKVILLSFLLLYIVLALYKVYSSLWLLLFHLGSFVCVTSWSTIGFIFTAV